MEKEERAKGKRKLKLYLHRGSSLARGGQQWRSIVQHQALISPNQQPTSLAVRLGQNCAQLCCVSPPCP